MFGFLTRKRRIQQIDMLLEAAGEVTAQKRAVQALEEIAAANDLFLPKEYKPVHLAAAVAAHGACVVALRCDWDLCDLDANQTCKLMLVLSVACDHLSRITGTEQEECILYAPIMNLGPVKGLQVINEIEAILDLHNSLAIDPQGASFLQAVGNSFAAWINHCDDEALDPIANLLESMTVEEATA